MSHFRLIAITALALLTSAATHAGALGSAFTYQGELNQSGVGVNDNCDFSVGLWDAASGGVMVGQTDLFNVPVSEGIFTVKLDFGAGAFTGDARWLEIAVVCPAGGGVPTPLAPRQELTAAPNALFALEAGSMEFSDLTGVPAGLSDGDDVDDADADPTNEIQDLELSGNTLSLTGDASPVDLSGYLDDTDDQNLADVLGQGNDAGGTTITNLPGPVAASDAATMAYVDAHTDSDSDATNELQNLFATVNADTGGTTADAQADTLGVVGSGSVSTEITGDMLTIAGGGVTEAVRDPVVVGSLGIGIEPVSVYVSGRYAYVVDVELDDLRVIDVSNPASPTLVGNLAIGAEPRVVYVAGRYAYIITDGASNNLEVIDVSNPGNPTLSGSLGIGSAPKSLYVSGRYAYVIDSVSDDLKIIEVSDPSAPSLVGSLGLGTEPFSVFVSGRYAYIVDAGSDDLKVIDVADPGNPVMAGSLGIGDIPLSVYVSGRYAYIVDSGSDDLKVIDVSDPGNPALAGSLGLGNFPASLYVSGRYAYITENDNNEIRVIDVSDPSNLMVVGTMGIGNGARALYVSGGYAYIVNGIAEDLKVVDVSSVEFSTAIAHSLEAGNLQVRNDVIAQGQLQVTGGVNVGAGGVFTDGNVGLSGTLAIANDIAPTASPANLVQLFADDDAGSSELKVRDEAGMVTTLSPHNFSLIGEPSEPMAWSFFSENENGKINVDMLRTVRLVEAMSGQKLVYIEPNGSENRETLAAEQSNGFTAAELETTDDRAGYRELMTAVRELAAQKDAEIEQLKAENQAMQDRLEALERKLN